MFGYLVTVNHVIVMIYQDGQMEYVSIVLEDYI